MGLGKSFLCEMLTALFMLRFRVQGSDSAGLHLVLKWQSFCKTLITVRFRV